MHHFDSDIDVLVDAAPDTGIGALADLSAEIERLTGFPADVISADSPPTGIRGDEALSTVAL